jgi:hypothetical protein
MGFGLNAGAFANGFMNGYRTAAAIQERDRTMAERERLQRNQEQYAQSAAQAFDNSFYETTPYLGSPDSAGQALDDPDFGLRASYPSGGAYAADTRSPGFGMSEITGERSTPDMTAYARGAMRAAGQYGQPQAVQSIMQNYQAATERGDDRGYRRQRDQVADRRWESEQERQQRQWETQNARAEAQDARAEVQDARSAQTHAQATEANRLKLSAEQRQERGEMLIQLGNLLDATGKSRGADAAAEIGTEFLTRFRGPLEELYGPEAKDIMGFEPVDAGRGAYNLLTQRDGGELVKKPVTTEQLRQMGQLAMRGPGATDKPEVRELYDAQGRKQAYQWDKGSRAWVALGGAEKEPPDKREERAVAAVSKFYSDNALMMKPDEIKAGVRQIRQYHGVDPETGRSLSLPDPPSLGGPPEHPGGFGLPGGGGAAGAAAPPARKAEGPAGRSGPKTYAEGVAGLKKSNPSASPAEIDALLRQKYGLSPD